MEIKLELLKGYVSDCFDVIEEIVDILEKNGVFCGGRHDF